MEVITIIGFTVVIVILLSIDKKLADINNKGIGTINDNVRMYGSIMTADKITELKMRENKGDSGARNLLNELENIQDERDNLNKR